MSKATDTKLIGNQKSYKKVILFSFFAGFLLLISNTAIWVNNEIFNTDNFTNTVTTSLTSDSSISAISQNITDRIYADKPIAKRIAGDFTTKVVGGLLSTDQFSSVVTVAAEKMQVYITSSDQQDVAIELGGAKDIITKLTTVSESLGRETEINPENIPDQITIIEANNIPDVYSVGVAMLWIAPITLIGALILIAYPYMKRWNDKRKTLMIQGAIITLVSLIGFAIGPLVKPIVISNINTANGRVVIGNLYDAFIATFNSQTVFLTLAGVLMVLVGTAWIGYPKFRIFLKSIKK
jgi:hypothetical protein